MYFDRRRSSNYIERPSPVTADERVACSACLRKAAVSEACHDVRTRKSNSNINVVLLHSIFFSLHDGMKLSRRFDLGGTACIDEPFALAIYFMPTLLACFPFIAAQLLLYTCISQMISTRLNQWKQSQAQVCIDSRCQPWDGCC